MTILKKCAMLCMALLISGGIVGTMGCATTMPPHSTSTPSSSTTSSIPTSASTGAESSSCSSATDTSSSSDIPSNELELVLGENALRLQAGETFALSLLGEEGISYAFTWTNENVLLYRLGEDGVTKIPQSSGFTISYETAMAKDAVLYLTTVDGLTQDCVLTVQRVLGMGEQIISLTNGQAVLDFYAEEASYFPLLPVGVDLEIWKEDAASFVAVEGLLPLSGKTTFRFSSSTLQTASVDFVKPTEVFLQNNEISLTEGKAYLLFAAEYAANYACKLSKDGVVEVFRDGEFFPLQNQIDLETEAGASYLLRVTAEGDSVTLSILSEVVEL